MSIPWNFLKEATGFINEQFIKPTAEITIPERYRITNRWRYLPIVPHPSLSPGGIAQPHNPARWIPEKVLGEGGMGIASLWRYNDPGHKSHNVQVVLKVGKGEQAEHKMMEEGRIMNILSNRNEQHLVNMVYFDQDFTKLYLEYCPEGDLDGLMQGASRSNTPATEEDVWRVFLCLIKGAYSMHHQYPPASVIHFDLKPANVMVQGFPGNHSCGPDSSIYKIGDFGLASEKDMGDPDMGSLEHANQEGVKGTQEYWSPEMFEFFKIRNNRRDILPIMAESDWEMSYGFTPKLDIWAIGAIVWELMVNKCTPVNSPNEFRVFGMENIYRCRPNKFVKYGGYCYGKDILSTGYSAELKSIVQWCLMRLPKLRCSAEELLPHLEAQVTAMTERRIAQEAQIKAAQHEAAMNAMGTTQPALTAVKLRIRELTRTIVERAAERQRLNYESRTAGLLAVEEPLANMNEGPGSVYAQRLQILLQAHGVTFEYYARQIRESPEEERYRLIDAFLFLEGDSPAWTEYINNGGSVRGDPGPDQMLIAVYQMALEDTEEEFHRCLKAYLQRVNVTNSLATRMELVIRQRRWEGTIAYRENVLAAFQQNHQHEPHFMEGYSDLAKMRFQRAAELAHLPILSQSMTPALNAADRQLVFDKFMERMDDNQALAYFETIMGNEGLRRGEWETQAINLELGWMANEAAQGNAQGDGPELEM